MVSSTSSQKSQMASVISLIYMSPASFMVPALLACFGPLVSAQDLSQVNCKQAEVFDYAVLIPHSTGCSSFFICKYDVPIEVPCPAEGGENQELSVCSSRLNKNCLRPCSPLPNFIGGTWTPASCTAGPNDKGALCRLQCDKGYELRGSSIIHCKNKRWNSVNGNFIPKCLPEECIGVEVEKDLNQYLSDETGILFVLDESGSVTAANFKKTKDFVKDVVQKYPLSENRSAGVITFNGNASLKIHLNVESTSDFLNAVDRIPYGEGATDLLAGLEMAVDEIKSYSKHNLTVVVVVTDGNSSTDGTPAADAIKKAGNPIFAIGIDSQNNLVHLESLSSRGANGIKHFFHIKTYETLENIGKYLNPPAGSGGSGVSKKCIY